MTMTSKCKVLGQQREFCVDGTPTGKLDDTAMALLNDYIWTDDGPNTHNNVKIEPMGIFATNRAIKKNEELCCDYGKDYNWDHVKISIGIQICAVIHQAQTSLCQNAFETDVISLRNQMQAWKTDPNVGSLTLPALLLDTISKGKGSSLTMDVPWRSWNNGSRETFDIWLPKLLSWPPFAKQIWYRTFGDPSRPPITFSDLLPTDSRAAQNQRRILDPNQAMTNILKCKGQSSDHIIAVVSTLQRHNTTATREENFKMENRFHDLIMNTIDVKFNHMTRPIGGNEEVEAEDDDTEMVDSETGSPPNSKIRTK